MAARRPAGRGRTGRRGRRAPQRFTTPTKHVVVYVHGICPHQPGYSNAWWQAMAPHVPSVTARREVLWSDLVKRPARLAAAPRFATEKQAVADVLVDRAQREVTETVQRLSGAERTMHIAVEPHAVVQTKAFLGLPGIDCIDDFLSYVYDDRVRDRVIRRFTKIVRPLLVTGDRVEVISHSWGSVVAYEALRVLEGQKALADHAVHSFFTVGSPLSIPTVRRWLKSGAHDQPLRGVQNWANLDARFDIVGGSLKGWFAVGSEHLDLDPVGCPGLVPSFTCAHSSYFDPANLAVNRDIFGWHIERAFK